MKIAIIVLLAIGTAMAQDCSTKFTDLRKCMEDSHKKGMEARKAKFEAIKAQLDACYTTNGCTAPARKGRESSNEDDDDDDGDDKRGRGNRAEGRNECRKAFQQAKKAKMEECIKKTVPDFTRPPMEDKYGKRDGHRWGGNHKDDNKALEGCANKQAVRDCKRALINSSRPSEDERKAQFQANCDAKAKCMAALGADCQAQLEKIKKAACDCREQLEPQEDQIRAGITACQGAPERKGTRPPRRQDRCDRKDYCKLGYDAFVQDHQKGKGPHH